MQLRKKLNRLKMGMMYPGMIETPEFNNAEELFDDEFEKMRVGG